MKKYRFHWLDGSVSEGEGYTVAEAFSRLEYGSGAVAALDWYEIIKDEITIQKE